MRDDSLQQVTRSWNIKFIERKCSNIGAAKRAQAVGNLILVVQEEITARRLMRIDCLSLLVTLAMKVTKLWKSSGLIPSEVLLPLNIVPRVMVPQRDNQSQGGL